jgi:hypothetical protein
MCKGSHLCGITRGGFPIHRFSMSTYQHASPNQFPCWKKFYGKWNVFTCTVPAVAMNWALHWFFFPTPISLHAAYKLHSDPNQYPPECSCLPQARKRMVCSSSQNECSCYDDYVSEDMVVWPHGGKQKDRPQFLGWKILLKNAPMEHETQIWYT